MPTHTLTPEIIAAAIDGFEAQKHRIEEKIAELRAMLRGGAAASAKSQTPGAPSRQRGRISAAGRRAIAEAQRKRWAALRGQSEPAEPQASPKPKRKLSAAGRRAIVAATKARWARFRAEAAKAKKSAPDKKPVAKKAAKKTVAAPPAVGASAAQ